MAQAEPATASDLAAGTTAVTARPCLVWAATLNGGSATATLILYDHPSSASGTVIGRLTCATNTSGGIPLLAPIFCAKGCTAVVAGTGATAQVYFSQAT